MVVSNIDTDLGGRVVGWSASVKGNETCPSHDLVSNLSDPNGTTLRIKLSKPFDPIGYVIGFVSAVEPTTGID